jgi:hypothetical protein
MMRIKVIGSKIKSILLICTKHTKFLTPSLLLLLFDVVDKEADPNEEEWE